VVVKGRYHQTIAETEVSDPSWAKTHWKTLMHAYASAPHFDELSDHFGDIYGALDQQSLSQINHVLITAVCNVLGIDTTISWSTDYEGEGAKTTRLVSLCRSCEATRYLSGPSARSYIDEQQFAEAGIELAYVSYDGYPEYPQLHGPFDHHVSILDLLFNVGAADAAQYMKSFSFSLP
jgi:hypothetical protein